MKWSFTAQATLPAAIPIAAKACLGEGIRNYSFQSSFSKRSRPIPSQMHLHCSLFPKYSTLWCSLSAPLQEQPQLRGAAGWKRSGEAAAAAAVLPALIPYGASLQLAYPIHSSMHSFKGTCAHRRISLQLPGLAERCSPHAQLLRASLIPAGPLPCSTCPPTPLCASGCSFPLGCL